jgi:hypothetical protein
MRLGRGLTSLLVLIGFVSITQACASTPANATGVTSAQMTDGQSAASRLAETTCEHAAACHQIGESKSYASQDACMTETRIRYENGLRTAECPRGVATTRLEACVSEVTKESCSGMPGGFHRMMSCKMGALCP